MLYNLLYITAFLKHDIQKENWDPNNVLLYNWTALKYVDYFEFDTEHIYK